MLTMIIAATMITTGGFGVFPPNELTRQAAQLVSENVPLEIIESANLVLEQASAPTLEAIDRSASTNDNPIVVLFEALVEPLFMTQPEATAQTISPETASENSDAHAEKAVSITPEVNNPATTPPFPSPSVTLAIPILTGTQTFSPSPSVTLAPTWTFIYAPPTPTKTRQPPSPTRSPAPTTTSTITPTSTPPFGPQLIITNVSFNGGGSSINVAPGSTVNVTYDYQVMSDYCPGCITQLVTGLGTPGSHGGDCAYNGSPGMYPGATGSENITLTMPSAEGTYDVSVLYSWQYDCPSALAAYGPGGDVIGQITVSCTEGLNLIASFPVGNWIAATWDGTNWDFTPISASPDSCPISVLNNSAVNLPAAMRLADNSCSAYLVPAGGNWSWGGGNPSLCPANLYAP